MLIAKNVGRFTEGEIQGELVLMHIDTGRFHGLSGVGLAIWRLLDSEGDPTAITAILADRYDVDPETCAAEVDAFLRELERAQFVTVS